MPQPDWDHKHLGDYPAYADTQHGPNLHTHGADGKVDTIMGKSTNPMHSRCGLEDCDCEYTIGGLLRRLELIADQARLTVEQTRTCSDNPGCACTQDCICYQTGYEAEHRP